MSRVGDFTDGIYFEHFLGGFHEERTEDDPANDQEHVVLRDSDDTPRDFL